MLLAYYKYSNKWAIYYAAEIPSGIGAQKSSKTQTPLVTKKEVEWHKIISVSYSIPLHEEPTA